MFTGNELYARIKQRPFVPLRLMTSDGESYDVYHPDLVIVGQRYLIVGTASSKDPNRYEQVSRVSILHITALEDLPAPQSSTSNGER